MTFEAAIRAFLVLTSGISDVKRAPYRGDRPASPYATYQINTVAPMIDGYKSTYNPTGSIDTRYTSAVMTVSVNAYADYGYRALSQVLASNDWWEARQTLTPAMMAFQYGGTINTLTALGDTDWRSRYQCDLTFHVDTTHDRIRYLIEQWELTGNWGDIEITTNYP